MYYLGVDLGGTNIAVGLVDESGKIIVQDSTPTNAPRPAEEIVADMATICQKLVKEANISIDEVKAIGIGSPGSINNKTGELLGAANLGIEKANIRELMQQKINKPVTLENDANAAAMGEYTANGNNCESFIFITLGTGVGGGIILNGRLYSGFNFAGGELGHITIDMNGEPCTCGSTGCWEAYASVTALIRQTKRAMEANPGSAMPEWVAQNGKISGRTAFDCAKKGDKTALEVVANYQKYIAIGLISILNIFQPNQILIGGGISKEGDYLFAPVKDYVLKNQFYKGDLIPQIGAASLFNDAGIIGAAMCAAIDNE